MDISKDKIHLPQGRRAIKSRSLTFYEAGVPKVIQDII